MSLKRLFSTFFIFLFSLAAFANEEAGERTKKFDPGETVIEHVSDNHDWHIAGHLSVPLPVIIFSPGRGFEFFMSSRFEHGHTSWNGYHLDEKNKVVAEDGHSFIDFSITRNAASIMASMVLLVLMFFSIAKSYKKRQGLPPKGLQSLVEPLILFVRDEVAKPSIGPKYEKYMPYLLTIFFFIWMTNMLGILPILPGGANVMGNIAITMSLALMTFIITTVSANRHYWRHVFAMPGVPVWVLFILTPIEFLGVFLRPFVLMIRLFANMLAGHIVALSFICLIFIFGELSVGAAWGVSVVSVAFVVFMWILELLVCFLQAYVFAFLSAIYFGAAVEEHDHRNEAPHTHVEEAAIV